MKEYNRKTKRWEEPTGLGKFKQRDVCRGGKPHDYILSLPDWIKVMDNLVPEAILEYYLSEERRNKFLNEEDKKLRSLGLNVHVYNGVRLRHYRCSVCDKRKYGK